MIAIMAASCGETLRHWSKKVWLGDLDSNQDSQIQSPISAAEKKGFAQKKTT
jgi:hypothetical protein